MILTTTKTSKPEACLKHVAEWLQSEIEPRSKNHNLVDHFYRYLYDLFKEKKQFVFTKKDRFDESSEEFREFFTRCNNVEWGWFPQFTMNVDLERPTIYVLKKDEVTARPIYSPAHFENE